MLNLACIAEFLAILNETLSSRVYYFVIRWLEATVGQEWKMAVVASLVNSRLKELRDFFIIHQYFLPKHQLRIFGTFRLPIYIPLKRPHTTPFVTVIKTAVDRKWLHETRQTRQRVFSDVYPCELPRAKPGRRWSP